MINRIKKLEGSRWSQSLQVWHLPVTIENRNRFKITPHSQTIPSAEGIENIENIEKFKQWLRSKRYSESTITT